MKLLLDQDVYALTERFLREQERVFITRDRDYENLVFVQHAGSGVIYLRILPSELTEVHAVLKKVLETYKEDELAKSFIVVEKNRHRFRKVE